MNSHEFNKKQATQSAEEGHVKWSKPLEPLELFSQWLSDGFQSEPLYMMCIENAFTVTTLSPETDGCSSCVSVNDQLPLGL